MLTLNNISFSYQKNRFILKNISTNIDDTKITAIAGRNGSGKTTLTRLLMGLVHPNRGSMTLDDVDITKKEPYEMAQYIGYVFQNPDQLIHERNRAKNHGFNYHHIVKNATKWI